MASPPPPADHLPPICNTLPALVSSFVDCFVDYVVGGQFLGSNPLSPSPDESAPVFPRQEFVHPPTTGGLVSRLPAADRLVAVGDIHGDLGKAREALKIAGVIDDNDRWIGGSTTVVQVGDLLDRGGHELKVIYLLEKLGREARRAGGDVLVMNGNHEIMNIEGDFRYATDEALQEFRLWAHWYTMGNQIKERCQGLGKQPDIFQNIPETFSEASRARFAALRPGGPISTRFLASHPTVLMVGETVFVHGGLLPSHAKYGLERMNEEVKRWILGGQGRLGPNYLHGRNAVVWVRRYSELRESKCECDTLAEALEAIPGATRMIVGHTIQQPFGINGACNNRVIRVDVGMSEGCGNAAPEVLEIKNDNKLRVLARTNDREIKVTGQIIRREGKPGLGSLLTDKGIGQGMKQVEVRA